MSKPDIVVNERIIPGEKRKTVHMTDWKGSPVEESCRDGWVEELLAIDPPKNGEYSCIMSGDSMVLVIWDDLQKEWEIYDMKINRIGRARG